MRRSMSALLAIAAIAACGGDTPAPPSRVPTPLDPSTTGTIAGDVRVEGTVPAMASIRFGGIAECSSQHPGPVPTGDVLVQDGKVENAFVYVKSGLGERVFAIPETPVEVDQAGCLYRPRVIGVQVGQAIRFVNSDPLLHNVRGTPKASSSWNVSLSRKGTERTQRIDKPEVMVNVRCDLHPWMQAWVGVLDHPYFAVTGRDGTFTLRNVPAGTYTVAVWHERLGTREAPATVAPQGTATVPFTLTAP
jgi:plastocyanin